MILDITHMKPGESGIVARLEGGLHFQKKLQNMGLRLGKRITKISSQFWHGPQTVQVDTAKIAIGHGMATRIFVEVDR